VGHFTEVVFRETDWQGRIKLKLLVYGVGGGFSASVCRIYEVLVVTLGFFFLIR